MRRTTKDMPCAMTLAGSDSGAGAGIQADLFAFAANGVYGTSAIAAITAQNPDGVTAIGANATALLRAQADAIDSFYHPKAAKTGMLFRSELANVAADFFEANRHISLVVDPVMIATSGAKLLNDDAVAVLKNRLIPMSKIFTPNLDEAEFLLGEKIEDNICAAQKLRDKFGTAVLLKGGHIKSDHIVDILAQVGKDAVKYESPRIKNIDTHGSGCTLSAAITARIARGENLETACQKAREYLIAGMRQCIKIGGRFFINHFPKI